MKHLALLILFVAASAMALWQAQSIRDLAHSRDNLITQLAAIRTDIQSRESELVTTRHNLEKLRNTFARQQSSVTLEIATMPTPASEGWWPTNRPYFYMSKELLPLVRLRQFYLSKEEVERAPEMKQNGGGEGVNDYDFNVSFMNGNALNPLVGSLFGMTEEEMQQTGNTFAQLIHDVREIEIANFQKLDPPEPVENGSEKDMSVYARVPSITEEVAPLLATTQQNLNTLLGEDRAKVLNSLADIYFNENADGLGSLARDFVRSGNNISVRYRDQQNNIRFGSTSWYYLGMSTWRYQYLFPDGIK